MRMRAEMYSRMVIVGLAAGSLLCGCHKTALVYGPSALPNALAPGDINNNDKKAAAAKNQLPGIPFYNHYGVCTQEEVWLEPQTTISLTVTADGGKPVTQTITLNNAAFHDSSPDGHDANSLLTRLEEAAGSHSNENYRSRQKILPGKCWGELARGPRLLQSTAD